MRGLSRIATRRASSVTRRGGCGSGLVAEHGAQVSERQVSRYVRERRRALGEVAEAFVPQLHAPGIEGEVDWGEAWVAAGRLGARRSISFTCGCVTRARRSRRRF